MSLKPIIDVSRRPDPLKERIFFGEYGGLIRTDTMVGEQAKRLKGFSEGNVWFPSEIDFTNDDFDALSPEAQRIFRLNIAYQTLMDSGVNNGYEQVISQIVTNQAWAMVYKRIAIEEAIHAESYSYGLVEMFGSDEAEKILDTVYEDEFVKDRISKEVLDFSDVQNLVISQGIQDDSAKKAIIKMILRTYLLETIKFPFSFFVTFAINKAFNSAIQGMSRLIKLIAHDELTFHVPVGHTVLKILRTNKDEGFYHLMNSEWYRQTVIEMTKETVESEITWLRYLLIEGPFQGFNQAIGEHFLKYQAMTRLPLLGIKDEIYKEEKSDTINFFNTQKDLNLMNTAMQEAENSAYQKGVLKNDFPTGPINLHTADDILKALSEDPMASGR